jgi:hypothetical protein
MSIPVHVSAVRVFDDRVDVVVRGVEGGAGEPAAVAGGCGTPFGGALVCGDAPAGIVLAHLRHPRPSARAGRRGAFVSPRDPRPARVRGVGREAAGRRGAGWVSPALMVRPAMDHETTLVRLVGTAPDADEDVFPLDTPLTMSPCDPHLLDALGASGSLPGLVAEARARLLMSPADRIVVMRIDEDEAPARSRGRWDWWLGRHVWSFFGFRSAGGAADPRAPP